MEQLLTALNVGGDIGIWVLVAVVWRFHDRILRLELQVGRLVSDYESEKRTRSDAHRSIHNKLEKYAERITILEVKS